jgi:hypothetical protein
MLDNLTARFRPFSAEQPPGRSVRRLLRAFLLLVPVLPCASSVNAQTVAGFDVVVYSTVIDPVRLAFGAGGALFVGRDPVAGGSSTALKIHRVATDGSYAEYGNSTTPDPDALVATPAGRVGVAAPSSSGESSPGQPGASAPSGRMAPW